MMEKQLIPQLRFPEFNAFWESKPFKELTKINQGLQIPISERYLEQVEGSYFYITNEFLKKGSKNTYFIKNPSNSVLCNEDDILMTRTGNTGMVVTNVSGAFHNNFFKIAYPDYINKTFLYYFLTLDVTQNFIKRLAGTSTIPDLNHSDFYKIKFNFPSLSEQQKIASFLSDVDEVITKLTKKKTLLEQYKKGIMKKIFNQELRFKDDNGNEFPDWEEKKLGDIGKFQTSSVDKLSNPDEQEVFLVNYMNVYKHETISNKTVQSYQVVTANKNQLQSSNLQKGDILFTPSSETPTDIGHSVVIFEDIDNAVYSYHVIRFRPSIKLNLLFSHYFCNTSEVLRQLSRFATGSTRFTISIGNFSKVKVKYPCLEEQTKIANFLSDIDIKIEALNTKIENSKTFKKGLLQKMFV